MTNLMNEQEFTQLYIDALRETFPDITINSTAALEVSTTTPDDQREVKHFLDNCFNEYLSNPNDLNDILDKYLAPLVRIYKPEEATTITDCIFPTIKDTIYIKKLKSIVPEAEELPMVYEKYNDELYVFYGVDDGDSIGSLSTSDFEELGMSIEALRELALNNLANTLEIEAQADEHLIFLTADGNYEASLILLTDIWTKENFPVEGEIVIGVPARDVLVVCGSEDTEGLAKLESVISDIYSGGDHIISDKKFVFRNGKFEVFS